MNPTSDLNKEIDTIKRIIWSHKADIGPVIVIFSGIHGNETAGIYACKRLANKLSKNRDEMEGSVFMISGNRKAIKKGFRYLDRDLNRIWNEIHKFGQLFSTNDQEWDEALEILDSINEIIEKYKSTNREIHFIDLHTTSADSSSFILFNDTLENRNIAKWFPVPQILGIEESIHGTLLSYINDFGYPAIGFEAGGHTDPASTERTEAFLWLYFHYTDVINLDQANLHVYEGMLREKSNVDDQYYEINYHHVVEDALKFRMKKGFKNFDAIRKGELLAYEDSEPVHAPVSGLIFMPLYQKKGNDGFFILKGRSPLWLELSTFFRDSFINRYLHLLPGVEKKEEGYFTVNLNVARFLVKEIFHLLGYRVIRRDENTLNCYKR